MLHVKLSGSPGPHSDRAFRPGPLLILAASIAFLTSLSWSAADAQPSGDQPGLRQQVIPILATTFDRDRNPVGVVTELQVGLSRRDDQNGIDLQFQAKPGRFSPTTQVAVLTAILRAARVAKLNPDSWTILLVVPHRGVTVHGKSLSAMVGLTVVALAKGHSIKPSHVVTGTIERDGRIGAVSGIALKLQAAHAWRLGRVLIPDEYVVTEGDWSTPFLLHVSPVGSVTRAYRALTDHDFPGKHPAGS